MLRTRLPAVALVAIVVACGGEPTDPLPTNDDPSLSGTFRGRVQGVDDDVTLTGTLTLELTESAGELTGAFGLEGTLDDGLSQFGVSGAGPAAGTVAADDVAAVYLTASPDFCPAHIVYFGGTYNRLTGVLYVGVAIDILDVACTVLLTYPVAISLTRSE